MKNALKHLEAYVPPHRLTQRCSCGRKADIGINVDHPHGALGQWVCRQCHEQQQKTARPEGT